MFSSPILSFGVPLPIYARPSLFYLSTPVVTSSSRRLARKPRVLKTGWHVWRHYVHGKWETSTKTRSWWGDTYIIISATSLIIVVIIRALVALFAVGLMGVMGGPRAFRTAGICRETLADCYIGVLLGWSLTTHRLEGSLERLRRKSDDGGF